MTKSFLLGYVIILIKKSQLNVDCITILVYLFKIWNLRETSSN